MVTQYNVSTSPRERLSRLDAIIEFLLTRRGEPADLGVHIVRPSHLAAILSLLIWGKDPLICDH
jgi:hypothetical protein